MTFGRHSQLLNESEKEKSLLKKEIENINKLLSASLKEKNALIEENRVKDELLEMMIDKESDIEDENDEDVVTNLGSTPLGESQHTDVMKVCDHCDFETESVQELKKHSTKHNSPFKCDKGCSLVFESKRFLDLHIGTKHKPQKISVYR